jgi:hypothetical protein
MESIRERGGASDFRRDECLHVLCSPFHLDGHTVGIVADVACQIFFQWLVCGCKRTKATPCTTPRTVTPSRCDG